MTSRILCGLLFLSTIISPTTLGAKTPSAGAGTDEDAGPRRYLVVLEDSMTRGLRSAAGREAAVEGLVQELVADPGRQVGHRFAHVLPGFAAVLDEAALKRLENDPRVAWIEPDQEVRLHAVQTNAPWHLDRIDQPSLPLNGTFDYDATGAGVNVYIVDTGIKNRPSSFGNRVVQAFSAILDEEGNPDPVACNDHGTWVAEAAAGATFGVAKAATLHAVRVIGACPDCPGGGGNFGGEIPANSLGGGASENDDTGGDTSPVTGHRCFTSIADVIAGLDWVRANHLDPAVVNISAGTQTGTSETLDSAVRSLIGAGIPVVVSAGNSHPVLSPNPLACAHSPSGVTEALVVGATNINDQMAGFSKVGSCVDLSAPGENLPFSYPFDDGTSFSAPLVTGAVAQYLEGNPAASPAQVHAAIVSNASTGQIVSPPANTANRILDTSFIGAAPPDLPPVAEFTLSCQGLDCDLDGTLSTDDNGITWCVFNYGDGTQDSFAPPCVAQHTFPASGGYTVRLTVFDGAGQHHSRTRYPHLTADPITLAYQVTDDGFVREDLPSMNFGQANYLFVRSAHAGQGKHSYLRFALPSPGGQILSAKLRLKTLAEPVYNLRLYHMDHDAWTESSLTWNDSPLSNGPYTFLHETSALPASTWIELDVSSVVTGAGTYTFGMTAAMNVAGRGFFSDESTIRPELVLTVQP